ncbi:MAG TPA: hypothetical protein VMS32_00235 [Verrucomicrobiae bacterium]|jgi:hypothetical protein|nr:hypothetical protein [Verrucomicrobiae bacterium]
MPKNIAIITARTVGASVAAFALFASLSFSPASAQTYPQNGRNDDGYGNNNGSYGQQDRDRETVDGVVASFDRFNLVLRVGRGQDIAVHLHQGTIINPTGTTLRRGMRVDIRGYQNGDGALEANRIDVTDGYRY